MEIHTVAHHGYYEAILRDIGKGPLMEGNERVRNVRDAGFFRALPKKSAHVCTGEACLVDLCEDADKGLLKDLVGELFVDGAHRGPRVIRDPFVRAISIRQSFAHCERDEAFIEVFPFFESHFFGDVCQIVSPCSECGIFEWQMDELTVK